MARILYHRPGGTYLCSGTLLNDERQELLSGRDEHLRRKRFRIRSQRRKHRGGSSGSGLFADDDGSLIGIASAGDSALFTIDDTDLIRVKAGTALAEEARSVYTVTAQVSDGEDVHGSVEPAPAIDDTITVTVYVDDGVHRVPLLPAASHPHRDGMVRVINRSARAGEVSIAAFDAEGTEYGPLRLRIGANAAARFTSADLERGNAERGLAGAIGEGEGDWRLELTSALDLEVPAYARTRGGGTLASMHEVAPEDEAGHRVVFFNPREQCEPGHSNGTAAKPFR